MNVMLSGFPFFPTSILAHATYVPNLQFHLTHFDTQNPDQTRLTPPSSTTNHHPGASQLPISLSVVCCLPETHRALERLVRERGSIFENRWINKLVLAPAYGHHPDFDEIGPCRSLLQAVEARQQGMDDEDGLSHFTLTSGERVSPETTLSSCYDLFEILRLMQLCHTM